MNFKVLDLGISNIRNKIVESLYFNFGFDFTRPVQIYGVVNNRCNSKCKMCDYWRIKDPEELPASVWIKGLKSLKSFVGIFHINLSGGEVLLKKDFFEILEYCKKENISVGFTTNGLLLNRDNIQRILDLNVFNINISLDSMDDTINDGIRGFPGSLAKLKENIDILTAQKQKGRKASRIILKPTVCSENLNGLDKIVEYAQRMNLAGINFQPIFKWSKESEEMFKVEKKDLVAMIDKLVQMKKEGYNILNSEASIRQWLPHFNEEIPERNSPCTVALRNLNIISNGDVSMCGFRESKIGNIKNDDFREMWHSEKTQKLRKALVNCKRLCTATCVIKRSWKDYIDLFVKLMEG